MFCFLFQSFMKIYECPKRFSNFFENHRALTSTKPNSFTFLLPVNKASLYHSLVTKDLLQGVDSADLIVQQPVLRVDDVHGGLLGSLKHNMVADFLFTWEKKEGNWNGTLLHLVHDDPALGKFRGG